MASIADVICEVQTADPSTEPNVEITYFDIGSIDNEAGRVKAQNDSSETCATPLIAKSHVLLACNLLE